MQTVIFVIATLVGFITQGSAQLRDEPIVVLDSWRNKGAYSVGCDAACREAIAFDDQLMAQFSINTQCSGIRLLRTKEPFDNAAVVERHWWLTIRPGGENPSLRSWDIAETGGQPYQNLSNWMSGEGSAKQIAADVCAIATKRGAKTLR
jgi:hypothetical protein